MHDFSGVSLADMYWKRQILIIHLEVIPILSHIANDTASIFLSVSRYNLTPSTAYTIMSYSKG